MLLIKLNCVAIICVATVSLVVPANLLTEIKNLGLEPSLLNELLFVDDYFFFVWEVIFLIDSI